MVFQKCFKNLVIIVYFVSFIRTLWVYKKNPNLLGLKRLNQTKEKGSLNGNFTQNRLLFNSNISVSHSDGNLSSDSGLILAKELMDKFKFSRILRKNIQMQDDRLYYIHENESILEQIVLQLIARYGSEENYQTVVNTFDKVPIMPYGMYHKEKSKKYASNSKHRHN